MGSIQVLKVPTADVRVRFIQRLPLNTTGNFTIADLERAKNHVHDSVIKNATYGFDQYFDNHIALTTTENLPPLSKLWDGGGVKYHAWRWALGGVVYVVEQPTGETIEVNTPDYKAADQKWDWKRNAPEFVEKHGVPCGCPINLRCQ